MEQLVVLKSKNMKMRFNILNNLSNKILNQKV
jgi:hypothetical protein